MGKPEPPSLPNRSECVSFEDFQDKTQKSTFLMT